MSKDRVSLLEFSKRTGLGVQMLRKYIDNGIIAESLYTRTKTGQFQVAYLPALQALERTLDRSKKGALAKAVEKVEHAIAEHMAKSEAKPKDATPPPDILPDPTTVTEANKQKLIYQAKRERVKYEQEIGKLVDREAVYKELFKAGQEIREAMLAIPDRVIDALRSTTSRSAAHKLLTDAIHEELTRLGKYEQR